VRGGLLKGFLARYSGSIFAARTFRDRAYVVAKIRRSVAGGRLVVRSGPNA
jgi:hypothetical protein